MLVRMLVTAAGPPGTINARAGDPLETTKAKGEMLIKGGFALDESEHQRREAERLKNAAQDK